MSVISMAVAAAECGGQLQRNNCSEGWWATAIRAAHTVRQARPHLDGSVQQRHRQHLAIRADLDAQHVVSHLEGAHVLDGQLLGALRGDHHSPGPELYLWGWGGFEVRQAAQALVHVALVHMALVHMGITVLQRAGTQAAWCVHPPTCAAGTHMLLSSLRPTVQHRRHRHRMQACSPSCPRCR